MDTIINVIVVIGYFGFVSSSAVFEVDLLRYEALPNKCCDGYRKIHFGPLRCNECDPYFNICLKQLPSGASQCVTTTRENNVHSKDLTDGNIHPNHLTLALQSWKGSLLVDVDVKDYDSTTKDDDIDHLYYTYAGQPDPSSKTIVINGTKVRLTIAIKMHCSLNYYGTDCTKYCKSSTTSYCDSTGSRRCRPGYTESDCSESEGFTTAQSDLATKDITVQSFTLPGEMPALSTNAIRTYTIKDSTDRNQQRVVTMDVTTIRNEFETRPNTPTSESKVYTTKWKTDEHKNIMTTEFVSTERSQQGNTRSLTSEIDHTQSDITRKEATGEVSPTKAPSTDRNRPSQRGATEEVSPRTAPSTDITRPSQRETTEEVSQTTAPSTDRTRPSQRKATEEVSQTTAPSTDRTRPLQRETTDNDDSHGTTLKTETSTIRSVIIPEPMELYSCNLVVRGHRTGVHTQVVSIIYNTLSTHPDFLSGYLLGVNTVSSTFETVTNGEEVTDVSYVVHYNGQILRSEYVVRILAQPPVARVLHDRLKQHDLARYDPHAAHEVSVHKEQQTWVSSHLPFVIVMSCVVFIAIVIPGIVVIKKTCAGNGTPPKTKEKFSDRKSSTNCKGYDTPYSIENPAYDFESEWPAYKNSHA